MLKQKCPKCGKTFNVRVFVDYRNDGYTDIR